MLEEAIANQVSDARFLLPLLGKIQMKAGRWRDGVDSFKKCIAIVVSTGRIFSFWQSSGCLFLDYRSAQGWGWRGTRGFASVQCMKPSGVRV